MQGRFSGNNRFLEYILQKLQDEGTLDNSLFKNRIAEVSVAGENHDAHCGARQYLSSEGSRLKYRSHSINKNQLVIVQESPLVEISTYFSAYDDTSVVRVHNEVKNISNADIVLESVSSFTMYGLEKNDVESMQKLHFYRFTNSHHIECQPVRSSFFELGLTAASQKTMKRISGFNTGSWSTKEELPQGIIENEKTGEFMFFQIESNNSWYYEIGDNSGELYIILSGANERFNQWSKKLAAGEIFTSVSAAVCFGGSLNEVIDDMTTYRRHIVRKHLADKNLPTIFNEYMHLSWDSPFEEQTKKLAPVIKDMGIEYYVIDCGWHNEEDGNIIYPYVGQWKESKKRFPSGIKHTIDYLHSLGLKAGLWLEPEIIGHLCKDMQEYYDDSCFLQRNGKRITVMGRQFLDFRNNKVTDYLNGIIDELVGEYKVDYLKLDYNQDCGAGTEIGSDSLGDGLIQNGNAYFKWIESIYEKYPELIIETCSSGGMRMDYKTMSYFPLVSTSDQTRYYKYAYIVGNILSAVIPEQAAVWSYPVSSYEIDKDNITAETVIMNMINSFLGRMHLASDIGKLSEEYRALVREGVSYYKSLTQIKTSALPYFPLGFTDFSKNEVAAGFKTDKKLYLAVWNLKKQAQMVSIPLRYKVESVKVCYPKANKVKFTTDENLLKVQFDEGIQARFFEIELKV